MPRERRNKIILTDSIRSGFGTKKAKKYEIIRDIMNKINSEWRDDEIMGYVGEKYELVDRTILNLYFTTAKAALDYRIQRHQKDIAEKNYARINSIIDEALEGGKLKVALDAIDTLNKMGGIYTQKVDITAEKPVFEVKIGGA